MINKYLLLAFCAIQMFVAGCSIAEECEVPLESMDAAMSSDIAKNLDSSSISYQRLDDGRLCVRAADANEVAKIMHRTVMAMIPPNYSVSLDKPVHDMVITELGKQKIPYRIRNLSGNTYIVWNSEDEVKVTAIIDKKEEEYSAIWFEKNK